MDEKTAQRVLRRKKGSLIHAISQNSSLAPAGRPLNVNSSAQVDRPQAGGYNIEIALE
jgi:hypothetical protein